MINRRTALLVSSGLAALLASTTALAAQDNTEEAQPPAAPSEEATGQGADIVVTAQRRTQILMDVPQSVSAVGEAQLERQQADSFTEYAALVPGFTVTETNPGETRLVLRGVNTGSVGSTVAVYVDETPFGSSSSLVNAAVLAGDFDTFDVGRVEVVRGPQGTLYGANALGGVLKFVTNPPELGRVEGRARLGLETVQNGDLGYNGNAMFNAPLGDKAAVRASGFYRSLGGYIDSIGLERSDINDSKSYGGRLSVLFEPTETVSVRLTGLAQNIRVDAPSSYEVDPETLDPIDTDPFTGDPVDGRVQAAFIRERNDVDYRLINGTLNWDLGFATLTSATSYSTLDQPQLTDVTTILGPTINFIYSVLGGITDPLGLALVADIDQTKFTQEVRLASPDSDRFEWQAGVYYTKENGNIFQEYAPFKLADQDFIEPGLLGEEELINLELDSSYKELAGFGNVTFHVTPEFELSAGGRYSHNEQDSVQTQFGALLLLSGLATPDERRGESSENVFTWSFSGLYEPSDNTTLYARVAKGYRPGGPNVVPPGAGPDFPFEFSADTLISYEAGLRMQTEDRRFAFDVSAYYNDWKDILVFASFPSDVGPVGANANGGKARTYGVELSALLRPVRGLSFTLNGALNDSELTEDTPAATGGLEGDELPFSPGFSASATADYEWALTGNTTAYVGTTVRFVGEQSAGFDADYRAAFGHNPEIPDYTAVDLRAGVEFGKFEVAAFAKNLFNSDGLVSLGGFGTRPANGLAATSIRPRSIGLSLTAGF